MTYQEVLDHIFGLGRFGMRPGLERIAPLLSSLGNPQNSFRSVNVVGTNGKGSTCAFLSSILTASGYRTGLFTSPHLVSFTERFRIDGVEVSEEEITAIADEVIAAAVPPVTFFELVTAMAFLLFARRKVDVAIIEAGMGGASDATSAAPGILSVITPISLDHRRYLGDSVVQIAREKGGIIRQGTEVVLAAQAPEVRAVLEDIAASRHSSLFLSGRDFSVARRQERLDFRFEGVELDGVTPGIAGAYQAENAGVALAAASRLRDAGFTIPAEAMRRGIESAHWSGRMEIFPGNPPVLLDGAHNPAGAAALAASLPAVAGPTVFVIGAMEDKDLRGILKPLLLPHAAAVVAVSPAMDNAVPVSSVSAQAAEFVQEVTTAGSVAAGIEQARQRAGEEGLVVVTGSLFVVGEARAALTGMQFRSIRG